MNYGKGKGDGRIKVDPRERDGFNPEPKPRGPKPPKSGGGPGEVKPPRPITGPGSPGWMTIMPVPNPIDREVRRRPVGQVPALTGRLNRRGRAV